MKHKVVAFSGVFLFLILILSSCATWVVIASKNMKITGLNPGSSNYGSPGYLHILFGSIILLCMLVPKVWAKRTLFFVSTLNVAWAVRNFLLITICSGGECPVKQWGIFGVLISSILLFVLSFFDTNIRVPVKKI